MHPLFEMAKGRVPTSVKKNGKRGYAEGSGQEHELRSNRRQVDDFGFTVMGREGSQESINNADKQSAVSTTTTPAPDDPHNPNGIVKTVNFTLEYSNDGEPVPGEPRRWAAV